jgi:hypothetical protein
VTWFRIDDQLPSHEKTLRLPRGARRLQAIGAFTLLGAWSSGHLTDGRLPSTVFDELGIPPRAVDDLVQAGFLDRGEHVQMHDFLDWNKSSEQVLAERAEAAKRQKRARDRAKASRDAAAANDDEPPPLDEDESEGRHGVSHGVTYGVSHGESESAESNRTSVLSQPDERPISNGRHVNGTVVTDNRNAATSRNTESHGVSHGEVTAVVTVPPTRPDPSLSSLVTSGGELTSRNAHAELPPPRCQRHINDPDPPPCGPCADARRTRTEAERAVTRQRAGQRSTEAHRAAQLKAQAVAACDLCDDRGYLPNGFTQCDHDPDGPERAKAGIAAARAAATRGKTQ